MATSRMYLFENEIEQRVLEKLAASDLSSLVTKVTRVGPTI
jgi:hypothetical protein